MVIRPITLHTPVIDQPEMNDAEHEELRRVWMAGVGDYEITGPASKGSWLSSPCRWANPFRRSSSNC